MRTAILADIHSNREAFEAVLAAAEAAGAQRHVLLGDIVGYGADPEWCVAKAQALEQAGATVIRGNHDDAVANPTVSMNGTAALAIDWTRRQLGPAARAYLAALPLEAGDTDILYVHADASAPASWNYVLDSHAATQHFAACQARVSFCGHVHRPALYSVAATGKINAFRPTISTAVPLLAQRRWLAVVGSVGQPRDGNPAAAFCLHDSSLNTLFFHRTAYDIDLAARKIRDAGLPASLANRLSDGR